MSYSNANYLINPNKLSTRVHYAPGGASSLSLAWDNTPQPTRQQYQAQQQSPYYKPSTEPSYNYPPQQRQQEQRTPTNYYQPQSQGGYSTTSEDSNRILEAELKYYQNRNRLIGGYEDTNNTYGRQQYTPPTNQYTQPNQYSQQYQNRPPLQEGLYGQQGYQQEGGKYGQRPEELDLAIQQHRPRQESGHQQYSPYVGQNQERTSVRVNNPPGGRSNIVFG